MAGIDEVQRAIDRRQAVMEAKARADSVYKALGLETPVPYEDETALRYRIRLARELRQYSPRWNNVDPVLLYRADAFDGAEAQIYADAQQVGAKGSNTPGTLREIIKRDASGREIREYIGNPRVWMSPFINHTKMAVRMGVPDTDDGITWK